MTDADHQPSRPKLEAEWRVRITLPSGRMLNVSADDEHGARTLVSQFSELSSWLIERRYVTEWAPVPLGRSSRTVKTAATNARVPADPGVSVDGAGD